MQEPLDGSVRILSDARNVTVLTGAGMSSESGVPTFRDALTGLWAQYDPRELATPEAFARNPARVFGWYLSRWRRVRAVEPHSGHRALVALASLFEKFSIITQNVDGLHQRAGSQDVVELHGSLSLFRCAARGHPFDADDLDALASGPEGDVQPPSCVVCGSPIRPAVVWFGEMLPPEAMSRATQAVTACQVLLVVGTSAVVYPAAELPQVAQAHGAKVIEVNPSHTPLSETADVWWPASAGAALPTLVEAIAQVTMGP